MGESGDDVDNMADDQNLAGSAARLSKDIEENE